MHKLCKVYACKNGTLGLHLSRAPWDPYPWVSDIQIGSSAQHAGMRIGDTVLEMNGCDVLGQKISEIATHIRAHWNSGATYVTVIIWRNYCGDGGREKYGNCEDGESVEMDHSINQQSLQKFATCLQHIAQLLECPVCLEVVKPPGWQCCNGHVMCNNCRSRSVKCPVCRVPLGPRGRCLLSDKLFTLLAESFPCDGIKSNRNSPSERRKCTSETHSYPKMAVAATMQPKIKAKDIKEKDKSLRQQDEKMNFYTNKSKNEYEENNTDEKLQLDNADKENVVARTNGGSGNLRACSNLRRTSRTGNVHEHELNNGRKIVKSHDDDDENVEDCDKQLANCSSSSSSSSGDGSSGDESSETTVSGTTGPATTYSREIQNNNNSNSNINELVKLALKSSKRNQEDNREQRWGQKITGQSHKLQDDEVTIVNNGMLKNRVQERQQQQQQRHQHQQQQQQQQYQNYHCPTGKSCCSYVKTSDTTASKLPTKTTTSTTMKKTTLGRRLAGNNNNNNTCHTNNNNNLSAIWTTRTRPTAEDDEAGIAADATLVLSPTTNKFTSSIGSLSCNKSWMPELQPQGTPTVPATCKLRSSTTTNTTETIPLPRSRSKHISAAIAATSCLEFRSEWQILTHLTREHRLPVSQFYGTYGQRIQVDFMHNKSVVCLKLRPSAVEASEGQVTNEDEELTELTDAGVLNYENVNNYKADTFFLACLPLNSASNDAYASPSLAKFAIFLWHLPAAGPDGGGSGIGDGGDTADVHNFATIIESKRTGIKWFGRSHTLAKSWSQIHAEGHFLMHEMSAQEDATDAFDIVIRIK